MDQTFLEVLVARKRNRAAGAMKLISGLLAVLSLFLLPFSFSFLLLTAAMAALAYYSYLQEWIEYEYSYVCRELTVDKIMARSRRKQEAVYLLEEMEVGAPENSYHLDGYRARNCSVRDYSSQKGGETFVLYFEGGAAIKLERNQELIEAFRSAAPSKIFLN